MPTAETLQDNTQTVKLIIPSTLSQNKIVEFSKRILTEHKKNSDYIRKMEVIDIHYARYVSNKDPLTGIATGEGIDAATQPIGAIDLPSTTPPVVVSQVDSMVGYLAEVYLSGSPLFPVVSSPANKDKAEMLETLIDDHATLGGYARQLLMFLKDGVKYNLAAVEAEWTSIDQYTALQDMLNPTQQKLQKSSNFYTAINRLDPYNLIWDRNVMPGDVAQKGDYAGYIEIKSRMKAKRYLQKISNENTAFNIAEALKSNIQENNYTTHPQISDYVAARRPMDGMNWYQYITGATDRSVQAMGDNFEFITLYARILPSDFALAGTMRKIPQIWKFVIVNSNIVVQAKRILSAYDYLPILFGQPLEDGLGYQTQSIAEGAIPYQAAAKTLFNIRFNSARRAVSDRALYDPDRISDTDVNMPIPASKIPVKSNALGTKPISDAYHQIPFDPRGTEGALQDGMQIMSFAKDVIGVNNPRQGQFQKGNKSVKEWNDTMDGGESRLRLPALSLEYQIFMPLKQILKLNIFQYGSDTVTVSQKSGKEFDIKIAELRDVVLQFRVADGYTPKSKLASTDAILQFMQLIGQSAYLQQSLGSMLPGMAAHLAQLSGIRGLQEYIPSPENAQKNIMQAGQMAGGVDPSTGQPYIPQLPPTVGA